MLKCDAIVLLKFNKTNGKIPPSHHNRTNEWTYLIVIAYEWVKSCHLISTERTTLTIDRKIARFFINFNSTTATKCSYIKIKGTVLNQSNNWLLIDYAMLSTITGPDHQQTYAFNHEGRCRQALSCCSIVKEIQTDEILVGMRKFTNL